MNGSHSMFYTEKIQPKDSMAFTGKIADLGGVEYVQAGQFIFSTYEGGSDDPLHNPKCVGENPGKVDGNDHKDHVGNAIEVAVDGLPGTFLAFVQSMHAQMTVNFWTLIEYEKATCGVNVTGDSGNWSDWGNYR